MFIYNLIEKKNDNSTKEIIHDIMSISRVNSKISTITKILANKNILYNLLQDEDYIPESDSFNITAEQIQIEEIINNFKEKNINYFVIKPAEGTLSDGIGIFKIEELNLNFINDWTHDPNNNKYSPYGQYNTWILSQFIQSFLWKLKGQNITSQVFSNLVSKVPELKFNFNDNIGRINKFRFWTLYTIIDNEFTSYLYKDGYAEIASEELTNYNKTQLDPANIEQFYENLLNVEDNPELFEKIIKTGKNLEEENLEEEKLEAATVGTYLDFARVVNESNFPLGPTLWKNILMPQLYIIVNTLANKIKRYLTCLNKYTVKGSKGCYSLFALDIIIDENSKPWLLETNSRPFIGFGNYWNKYDPNNQHCLNVESVLNTVLGLTTDLVNGGGIKCNYSNFLVTNIETFTDKSKIYVPLSLGIKIKPTSQVYNDIYSILDKNNYSSFPYPNYVNNKNTIGFRMMSPIGKFLMEKIGNIGNDNFISLLQDLYPYDAKMKILNKISTLGFYLGNKVEFTNIIKKGIKNWDQIIPYSITVNLNLSDEEIINQIRDTPLASGKIIAKPAQGQQGRGIIITNNINTLVTEMKKNIESNEFVVSKYLENPYLIKLHKVGISGVKYEDTIGRKCHLRAYVLVSKSNNTLKVYFYKKSLIFCAAKEYITCQINKEYCDLTNLYYGSKYYKEILNKNPEDAYKDLSGNTDELIPSNQLVPLINRIKNIIKEVTYLVKDDLICLNRPNSCYQYIAFDFHLENDPVTNRPVPWLLEINATPGLRAPNYQWDGINNFLESLLNIIIQTNIPKSKQLFEYLPQDKKIYLEEIPFRYKTEEYCMSHYYSELARLLQELKVPGRSFLFTKKQMCRALNKII